MQRPSGNDHANERENLDFTGTIINEYNSHPSFWWMWLIVVVVVRLDELSHQLFVVD